MIIQHAITNFYLITNSNFYPHHKHLLPLYILLNQTTQLSFPNIISKFLFKQKPNITLKKHIYIYHMKLLFYLITLSFPSKTFLTFKTFLSNPTIQQIYHLYKPVNSF